MRRFVASAVLVALFLCAAPTSTAQFINVDVSPLAGSPSAAFGAAALMDGTWNTIVGPAHHADLLDRLGNPTNVGVQVFGSGVADAHLDHPSTPGDQGALLDDWRVALWIASFNEVNAFVDGLAPGFYEVTTYAWAADNPAARMNVFVQHSSPPVETGGSWPGGFVHGITHARHVVEVTAAGAESTLVIRVITANANDGALNGFQIIPLGDNAAGAFCTPQSSNSTGLPARLSVLGSDLPGHDFLVADCRDLPSNRFAYLLASQTQGFVPMPGGSQGNLCLVGNVARFVQQVQSSASAGVFRIELDLSAFPANPPQPVQAGDTWHFQVWYRDQNPAPTSNFSTGYTFAFQ